MPPQLIPCTQCKREVYWKQHYNDKGCAYCVCGNCGEPLGDGTGHFEFRKTPDQTPPVQMVYTCPAVAIPF